MLNQVSPQMHDDDITAAERAEYEAWEQEEEYLRTASREELIEELRELSKSRTEMLVLATHACRWLQRNERFAALVIGADAIQVSNPTLSESLEQVLQVADMALRMLHMNRCVEERVAENVPAVAAVMIANRRHEARFSLSTWPDAARKFYLANTLASVVATRGTGCVLEQPLHPKTEYWAALMDVFPDSEFNVLEKHDRYDPIDGAQAKEQGYAAGYTSDDRPVVVGRIWLENPYAPNTFLNAVWHRAFHEGSRARMKEKSCQSTLNSL